MARPDLPSGTVTFLFTDIEGSTKLLHELGAEPYERAVAEHRRVLRDAFLRHDGFEVETQGDAFFIALPTARGALEAAAEAQHALASGPISVRMGLHTGTPFLGVEGYVGADVNLGARIAAAGHGGQVLVSRATRELVEAEVEDLGEHRLKDFDGPVWIFQLGSVRFPPLKTISNTNLPRPGSSFVGRTSEIAEVVSLFRDGDRVVTLHGPGGSGKTRPAIEAAVELVPEFRNGVYWVGLAALRDPALVLETIAQNVGAKDGLAEHIGERELLLLLDNFEQVVEAALELSSLLPACPNLRVLVTTAQILERLSQRVDLLQAAATPTPASTRCATIAWSHDLLAEEEHALFARLAVFRGGCTLDAAADVAATVDTLHSLVDKSLVRHTNERFWQLETIRDYALERLAESGVENDVRGDTRPTSSATPRRPTGSGSRPDRSSSRSRASRSSTSTCEARLSGRAMRTRTRPSFGSRRPSASTGTNAA